MTAENPDVLLARQPIYNTDKEVVAYELLFRENTEFPSTDIFDGNRATSSVLLSLFSDSDISTITHGRPAFVNFTAELINNPPFFDPGTIVIEVLEDVQITEQIITNLKRLKAKGYTLALDDFVMDERYHEVLKLIDIVKLELPAMNDEELEKTINFLKPFQLKLLAEKIETPEMFKRCKELGCEMFQGYFLSKPEVVTGKKISASKMAILDLIAEIQAPEIDLNGLTKVIARDPALSFKLLKMINSAAFKRNNTIDSIHRAVTLLGIAKIKSWASLLALSKLNDKPEALHFIALVRALMCEQLANHFDAESKDRFYTVGLLSCLDAFFDQQLQEVVEKLGLEQSLVDSLLNYEGTAGLALHTTLNFEKAQWHKLKWSQLSQYKLNAKVINQIYFDASTLALELSRS